MSHFYGTLQGSKGRATRCGTKKSGITTEAAGWGGAVRVSVWVNSAGQDAFLVELVPWQGIGERKALASGILGGQVEDLNVSRLKVPA